MPSSWQHLAAGGTLSMRCEAAITHRRRISNMLYASCLRLPITTCCLPGMYTHRFHHFYIERTCLEWLVYVISSHQFKSLTVPDHAWLWTLFSSCILTS